MLGLGRAETIHWLKTIFDTIWVLSLSLRTGRVNSSCHMKDSQSICDNYRGIALLSIPDKVLAKATLNRIKPELSCFSVKTSVALRRSDAKSNALLTHRIAHCLYIAPNQAAPSRL